MSSPVPQCPPRPPPACGAAPPRRTRGHALPPLGRTPHTPTHAHTPRVHTHTPVMHSAHPYATVMHLTHPYATVMDTLIMILLRLLVWLAVLLNAIALFLFL